MDGSDFDALTHALAAPLSRRVTLGGLVVAIGLALEEAVALAKNGHGKGKHNKGHGHNGGNNGRGRNRRNKHNKKKELCTVAGDACTFSVHPCCDNTVCCDTTGSGFRQCVPAAECCDGVKCSTLSSIECCPGFTCQQRDLDGFGFCLPG